MVAVKMMRFKIILTPFIVALVILAAVNETFAGQIYVSLTGSDETGDGSAFNPYRHISQAVAYADAGDTINVRSGTYGDGATYLYGSLYVRGLAGRDSVRLLGNLEEPIFILDDNSSEIIIEGFTFDSGNRALTINYSSPDIEIKNCRFINCEDDSAGAAIYGYYASVVSIHDNVFISNYSGQCGGAIFLSYCNARIYNNIFDENRAWEISGYGRGGAVYLYRAPEVGERLIENNIFLNNEAWQGGALVTESYDTWVVNNLFHDNAASYGGAIYIMYDYPSRVYNNIFMYNSPDGMYCSSTTFNEYANNDYFGNTPLNDCNGCSPLAANIYYVDPLFADWGEGKDYHLTDSSLMINHGFSQIEVTTGKDFDNQKRVLAGQIDIGPDEYADCSIGGDFGALTDTAGCVNLRVRVAAVNLFGYYDSIAWDFGDGAYAYNITNVAHNYLDTGYYTVKLHICTPCTTVTVARDKYVHIQPPPVPNFQTDTTIGCVPFSVSFTPTSATYVRNYLWNFGDGATSTEDSPMHIYEEPGTYTVRLYAYNDCGQDSLVRTGYIQALAAAVADFGAEPTSGSAPLDIAFYDNSLYNPISWSWSFGDGGSSSQKNPSHRYLFPGIYDVRLICANECGTPDTLLKPGFMRVFGFDLQLLDSTISSRYNFRYDFEIDSLYGLFTRDVILRASLLNNPTRGSVTLGLPDTLARVIDSAYLTASLSKDVPRRQYTIVLTGTGSGGAPVDTLLLAFSATSDSIIEVTPNPIEFGDVPEDSAKNLVIRIKNISLLGDKLSLIVSDISTSDSRFSAQDPGQFTLGSGIFREISVAFAPTDTGQMNANLIILSDDPAYPQFYVPMSGRGIPERTPPTILHTMPPNLYQEYFVTYPASISFSESILLDDVDTSKFHLFSKKANGYLRGDIVYGGIPEVFELSFYPTGGFMASDSIVATVSGDIRDLAGNSLDGNGDGQASGSPIDDYTFTFTTGLAVYPGDANNDGIVNEMDVLPRGVYGYLDGLPRERNGQWHREAAKSWNPVKATYADCNGDGLISGADLLTIGAYWGLTHEIEGAPTILSLEEIQAATANFRIIYESLNNPSLGEKGQKIAEVLSAYLPAAAEIKQFRLGRNFPNPFNPFTTVDFDLPRDCQVRLEIFNVLGQNVRLLVDRRMGAGFHEVTWDGTDESGNPVPTGVYFYRLSAEDFNEVKKMLLIR